MATITEATTNFVDNFKTLYVPERANEIIYNKISRPAISLLKSQPVKAISSKYAVIFDDGAGGSSTFANAQSNGAAPSTAGFTLSVKEMYRVLTVSNKALLGMKDSEGAFLQEQALRGTMMLEGLANDLEKQLFGKKRGDRGVVASISSLVVTLTNESDVRKWHVGDVADYLDASSSYALAGHTAVIGAIDRANKTVTFVTAVPTSLAADDVLIRQGDHNNGILGFEDYLPILSDRTGSTWTSFNGVDRSDDSERLGGSYAAIDSGALYDGINELIMDIFAVSGKTPDTIFMSVENLRKLRDQNADRVLFSGGGSMTLGSSKVELLTPVSNGPISIHPSPFISDCRLFAIDKASWQIIHLDKRLVGLDTLDGNSAMRASAAAAVEFRFSTYPQLRCLTPGFNGVGLVS